jgi:hypothetical protein
MDLTWLIVPAFLLAQATATRRAGGGPKGVLRGLAALGPGALALVLTLVWRDLFGGPDWAPAASLLALLPAFSRRPARSDHRAMLSDLGIPADAAVEIRSFSGTMARVRPWPEDAEEVQGFYASHEGALKVFIPHSNHSGAFHAVPNEDGSYLLTQHGSAFRLTGTTFESGGRARS